MENNIKEKKISKKKKSGEDLSVSYDKFKEFEGKVYTGARVGRGQRWYYKEGQWKEKKIRPDLWEFTYTVPKRRAGKAPEGSGAPLGTEYHWYILAHQIVKKIDANNYTTSMTGLKYKLAHKRADKDKWNISEGTQKKHLIKYLEDMAEKLKSEKES
jgi:hypothetical protein